MRSTPNKICAHRKRSAHPLDVRFTWLWLKAVEYIERRCMHISSISFEMGIKRNRWFSAHVRVAQSPHCVNARNGAFSQPYIVSKRENTANTKRNKKMIWCRPWGALLGRKYVLRKPSRSSRFRPKCLLAELRNPRSQWLPCCNSGPNQWLAILCWCCQCKAVLRSSASGRLINKDSSQWFVRVESFLQYWIWAYGSEAL